MISPVCKRWLPSAGALMLLVGITARSMGAQAGDDAPGPNRPGDTLQVLADVTLIDGACRQVKVNFGVVFRFAAQRGLAASSIMPSGPQRDDFERVLQLRDASFDRGELCGQVAANYAEALPGSITDRLGRSIGRP